MKTFLIRWWYRQVICKPLTLSNYKLMVRNPKLAPYFEYESSTGVHKSVVLRAAIEECNKLLSYIPENELKRIHLVDWYNLVSGGYIDDFPDFMNRVSVNKCGRHSRSVIINKSNPSTVHIGCFRGSKEEALEAIDKKYGASSDEGVEYCEKVHECFRKAKEKWG